MDQNERQKHKEWALKLLNDRDLFEKIFDETYKKYDKNNDGTMNADELYSFYNDAYKVSGGSVIDEEIAKLVFDLRDTNRNGKLEKNEFKIEFRKALDKIRVYNK